MTITVGEIPQCEFSWWEVTSVKTARKSGILSFCELVVLYFKTRILDVNISGELLRCSFILVQYKKHNYPGLSQVSLLVSLVCPAPFINRSVQEGSCFTAALAQFSIHKTILAASWLLWQHTDGHIVPKGNKPIHPMCARAAFWGVWGKIMKNLFCGGYIASVLSESMSVCLHVHTSWYFDEIR